MNDNHLIAEFMELEIHESNHRYITTYHVFIDDVPIDLQDLQYHYSWDWLMPVIEKIMDISFQEEGEPEDFYSIRDYIPDIGHSYKAVVEFIKEMNKGKLIMNYIIADKSNIEHQYEIKKINLTAPESIGMDAVVGSPTRNKKGDE